VSRYQSIKTSLQEINQKFEIKLVMGLLIVTILCWVYTIWITSITAYPPDVYHYLKELPYLYWLGLGALIICALLLLHMSANTRLMIWLSLVFIFLFICYLHGTHVLIYENPRDLDTYKVALLSELIITGDMTHPYINQGNPLYKKEFITGIISFGLASQLLGVKIHTVAKFYPLVFMVLSALFIYVTALQIAPSRYAFISPVFFASTFWIGQDHIAPQAFSYTMVTLLLLLFLLRSQNNHDLSIKRLYLLLIIIIFLVVVTTHPTTAIFLLIVLLMLYTLQLLFGKSSDRSNKSSPYFFVGTMLFMGYIFLSSGLVIQKVVSTVEAIFESAQSEAGIVLQSRNVVDPSISYLQTYYIRMFVLLFVAVLSIYLLYFLWRYRSKFNHDMSLILTSFLLGFGGLGCLLMASGYATYGIDRAYLFLLLPVSVAICLCIMILKKDHIDTMSVIVKHLIIICLVIAIIILPITKHCGDPYAFVSSSEYSGFLFKQEMNIRPENYQIDDLTLSNIVPNRIELKQGKELLSEHFVYRTIQEHDHIRIYDSGNLQILT
jgi:hypothetical protein